MLATAIPSVNDVGVWFAIVVAGISAWFVVKARKGTTDDDEAVKTATLMTAQVTALDSKVQLLESDLRNKQTEIQHLHELRAEDAKTIDRNAADLGRLTELVTQQAAVAQFRIEAFAWFESIAVAVDATPPKFPDHVPA